MATLQHVQTVSKTHLTVRFWSLKNFSTLGKFFINLHDLVAPCRECKCHARSTCGKCDQLEASRGKSKIILLPHTTWCTCVSYPRCSRCSRQSRCSSWSRCTSQSGHSSQLRQSSWSRYSRCSIYSKFDIWLHIRRVESLWVLWDS